MMTIRIGFIGAGRMAHLHAGHVHLEPDATIAAACDNGSGRARIFARDYGAAAYSDYRRMLDEQELDAVYICTPTPTHADIALECASRGLHLFVEKPLDLDLGAAMRLQRVVQSHRLVAMTASQWRYSPAYQRAQQLIGDEAIALVVLRWYWTRPPIRWMWDREVAGGQVVDQNIHLIDASQGLAGEVETVYAAYNARQVNFEPEFNNWDGYALALKYKQGAVGTCSGTYGLFPEIQKRPAADFCLRDRMVRITDQDVTLFTRDGVQSWQNNEPLHRGINRAFVAAVRAGDPASIATPLAVGIRSTAVTLAANRSAHTGHPVVIDEFLTEFPGDEQFGP
jgi:predicted dehydrogenase